MSDNTNEHEKSAIPMITEDGPVMRSVAIMSPPSMAPLSSFDRLSVHEQKPFVHQNTTFLKPNSLLSDEKKVPIHVVSNPWKVEKALPLPSNYLLDRSRVKISDASSLEISKRISDYFYKQSIAATYDDEKALAIGTNSNCLKFYVRLWSVTDNIVVEVQRYAGCSIEFQNVVKEVLQTAKLGKTITSPVRSFSLPPSLPKLPVNFWEESTIEALDIAIANVKESNRIDSHSLAMESVEQLSSTEHCRCICAKAILSADSKMLPIILSVIHRTQFPNHSLSEESVGGLDDCYRLMRRGAVNALANCLESLQSTSRIDDSMKQCLSQLSSVTTISSLVYDVANAETNPHDAAASCRCLHLLCQCNADVKDIAVKLGLNIYINNVSKIRHIELQQESVRLMELL